MSAYTLGKTKSLSELQLHASRSNMCRFSSTSHKHNVQNATQYASSRADGSRKNTCKGLNKPLGGICTPSNDVTASSSYCDVVSSSFSSGYGVSANVFENKIGSI